jgi:hypothetical protein
MITVLWRLPETDVRLLHYTILNLKVVGSEILNTRPGRPLPVLPHRQTNKIELPIWGVYTLRMTRAALGVANLLLSVHIRPLLKRLKVYIPLFITLQPTT